MNLLKIQTSILKQLPISKGTILMKILAPNFPAFIFIPKDNMSIMKIGATSEKAIEECISSGDV